MNVREVVQLLESDGWVLVSTEGSHPQFRHQTKPGRVTVSGGLGDDMPKGTLASVNRMVLLDALAVLETEPTLLGVSAHLLSVARRL